MSASENISNQGTLPRAIYLISHFSDEERDDFFDFVKGQYFDTDEKLASLVKYLKDKFFNQERQEFDDAFKKRIHNLLFPDKKSSGKLNDEERARLNNRLSKLNKLGLQFLRIYGVESDSLEATNVYYQQLTDHKLFKYFDKQQKDDKKWIEEQTEKDVNYYHKKYHVEYHELDYMRKHDVNSLVKNSNFPTVVNALDVYYLIRRIRLQLLGFSIMSRTQKEYDLEPMKFILELSKLPQYDCPLLNIYRTAYELEWHKRYSNDDAEKYASQLQELLNEYDEELIHESKVDIYTVLTNFYIYQVKAKDLTYSRKAFELFKDLHEKGLLLSDNKIRIGKLNATITASCHAGEFEWAEEILEKYRENIEEEEREGVYKFNLGQIAFYQKDYEKANKSFSKLEQIIGKHQAYSINSRILYLKCLYELEKGIDYVDLRCHSAREFIRTHKLISDVDRKAQNNFINTLYNLYRIKKGEKDREKLKDIQNKIQGEGDDNFDYISDVRWLLEKIDELKEKK